MMELKIFKKEIISLNNFDMFPEFFLANVIIFLILYGAIIAYNKNYSLINNSFFYLAILSLIFCEILIFNDFTVVTKISGFSNNIINDNLSLFSKLLICFFSILCLVITQHYVKDLKINNFEYTLLLIFTVFSLLMLSCSNNLLTGYLSIELQSISFYVLASMKRKNVFSTNAGLKYFVLGTLASTFFLFGASIIYGISGCVNFSDLGILFYWLAPNNNSIEINNYNNEIKYFYNNNDSGEEIKKKHYYFLLLMIDKIKNCQGKRVLTPDYIDFLKMEISYHYIEDDRTTKYDINRLVLYSKLLEVMKNSIKTYSMKSAFEHDISFTSPQENLFVTKCDREVLIKWHNNLLLDYVGLCAKKEDYFEPVLKFNLNDFMKKEVDMKQVSKYANDLLTSHFKNDVKNKKLEELRLVFEKESEEEDSSFVRPRPLPNLNYFIKEEVDKPLLWEYLDGVRDLELKLNLLLEDLNKKEVYLNKSKACSKLTEKFFLTLVNFNDNKNKIADCVLLTKPKTSFDHNEFMNQLITIQDFMEKENKDLVKELTESKKPLFLLNHNEIKKKISIIKLILENLNNHDHDKYFFTDEFINNTYNNFSRKVVDTELLLEYEKKPWPLPTNELIKLELNQERVDTYLNWELSKKQKICQEQREKLYQYVKECSSNKNKPLSFSERAHARFIKEYINPKNECFELLNENNNYKKEYDMSKFPRPIKYYMKEVVDIEKLSKYVNKQNECQEQYKIFVKHLKNCSSNKCLSSKEIFEQKSFASNKYPSFIEYVQLQNECFNEKENVFKARAPWPDLNYFMIKELDLNALSKYLNGSDPRPLLTFDEIEKLKLDIELLLEYLSKKATYLKKNKECQELCLTLKNELNLISKSESSKDLVLPLENSKNSKIQLTILQNSMSMNKEINCVLITEEPPKTSFDHNETIKKINDIQNLRKLKNTDLIKERVKNIKPLNSLNINEIKEKTIEIKQLLKYLNGPLLTPDEIAKLKLDIELFLEYLNKQTVYLNKNKICQETCLTLKNELNLLDKSENSKALVLPIEISKNSEIQSTIMQNIINKQLNCDVVMEPSKVSFDYNEIIKKIDDIQNLKKLKNTDLIKERVQSTKPLNLLNINEVKKKTLEIKQLLEYLDGPLFTPNEISKLKLDIKLLLEYLNNQADYLNKMEACQELTKKLNFNGKIKESFKSSISPLENRETNEKYSIKMQNFAIKLANCIIITEPPKISLDHNETMKEINNIQDFRRLKNADLLNERVNIHKSLNSLNINEIKEKTTEIKQLLKDLNKPGYFLSYKNFMKDVIDSKRLLNYQNKDWPITSDFANYSMKNIVDFKQILNNLNQRQTELNENENCRKLMNKVIDCVTGEPNESLASNLFSDNNAENLKQKKYTGIKLLQQKDLILQLNKCIQKGHHFKFQPLPNPEYFTNQKIDLEELAECQDIGEQYLKLAKDCKNEEPQPKLADYNYFMKNPIKTKFLSMFLNKEFPDQLINKNNLDTSYKKSDLELLIFNEIYRPVAYKQNIFLADINFYLPYFLKAEKSQDQLIFETIDDFKQDLKDKSFYKFSIQIGLLFIMISIFFKLTLSPFHFWAPDVYEDSPTSSTVFFTIVPKIAIFVFFYRLFYSTFFCFFEEWNQLFEIIIIISVIIGSFAGLEQTKMKSLMSYSSISHSGYLMIAFVSGTLESMQIFLFYLIIYMLSMLCIWSVFVFTKVKCNSTKKFNKNLTDLLLLNKSNTMLSIVLSIALFSMAGIPPLIGFLAKASLFFSSISTNLYFLSVISILCSVVSSYYYIKIIKLMFFENALTGKLYYPIKTNNSFLTIILCFTLIYLFINPTLLILLTYKISLLFFSS